MTEQYKPFSDFAIMILPQSTHAWYFITKIRAYILIKLQPPQLIILKRNGNLVFTYW